MSTSRRDAAGLGCAAQADRTTIAMNTEQRHSITDPRLTVSGGAAPVATIERPLTAEETRAMAAYGRQLYLRLSSSSVATLRARWAELDGAQAPSSEWRERLLVEVLLRGDRSAARR